MNGLLTLLYKMIIPVTIYTSGSAIEISGKIADGNTGRPIEKVYVYIIAGEEETLSDGQGNFKLTAWQSKSAKVYFEKKGYKKKELVFTYSSVNNKILLMPE